MTVSIVNINGIDAKIAGKLGYMSISVEDFTTPGSFFYYKEASSGTQMSLHWKLGGFEGEWRHGGLNITGYTGAGGNVVIPAKISRWPVTKIGYGAFTRGRDLISVTIPDSVTEIDQYAFSYNKLASITIGDNVIISWNPEAANFLNGYGSSGKKAGTYVRNGNNWRLR
jgi:hypothetical protein